MIINHAQNEQHRGNIMYVTQFQYFLLKANKLLFAPLKHKHV